MRQNYSFSSDRTSKKTKKKLYHLRLNLEEFYKEIQSPVMSIEIQLSTNVHIFDSFCNQNLAIGFDVFYRYHLLENYLFQVKESFRVEKD